jgi:hypothetical protein
MPAAREGKGDEFAMVGLTEDDLRLEVVATQRRSDCIVNSFRMRASTSASGPATSREK